MTSVKTHIDKYLIQNDLFGMIYASRGNNSHWSVKMPCNEHNFGLIEYVKGKAPVIATMKAKNNMATIKFRSK